VDAGRDDQPPRQERLRADGRRRRGGGVDPTARRGTGGGGRGAADLERGLARARPAGGPLVLQPQVAIGDDGRELVAWAQGGRQREGLAVRVARLSWPAAAGP
jgi:hypothetical protein